MKKTLVLGASPDPSRYSNVAVRMLKRYNHPVVAVGKEGGEIDHTKIDTGLPEVADVDTVTLYINKIKLPTLADYIFSLKPKRIIFNPGTENLQVMKDAEKHGIEVIRGCTLVMLSIGNY